MTRRGVAVQHKAQNGTAQPAAASARCTEVATPGAASRNDKSCPRRTFAILNAVANVKGSTQFIWLGERLRPAGRSPRRRCSGDALRVVVVHCSPRHQPIDWNKVCKHLVQRRAAGLLAPGVT